MLFRSSLRIYKTSRTSSTCIRISTLRAYLSSISTHGGRKIGISSPMRGFIHTRIMMALVRLLMPLCAMVAKFGVSCDQEYRQEIREGMHFSTSSAIIFEPWEKWSSRTLAMYSTSFCSLATCWFSRQTWPIWCSLQHVQLLQVDISRVTKRCT